MLLNSSKLHFSSEGLIIPALPTSQGHYETQRRFKSMELLGNSPQHVSVR